MADLAGDNDNARRGTFLVLAELKMEIAMKKHMLFRIAIFLNILIILLGTCSQEVFAMGEHMAAKPQAQTKKDDFQKLVLQLRWNHQFQFAGYYVANWNGYYKEEGLDVDIRSAFTKDGEILNATTEVAEGRADFGIGVADVLLAENKGSNMSIVASFFQRSAVEFYMKEATPFYSIYDLTKLNTARRKNDLLDIELQAMLISEGIKPDNSEMITYSYDFTANDLLTNKFDIIPGYLGTISYLADKIKLPLRVIKPIDYGIDFYGDSLFTQRSFAEKNPELVEKFRKASIKGWEYALSHPNEVAARIAKEFKIEGKTQAELLSYNTYQSKKVIDLTLYPVVQVGNINPYRWIKMQDTLVKLGLAKGNPDFDKFIFNYEKISNERKNAAVKGTIITMIVVFLIFILFMLINLASKNRMLSKEIAERQRVEEENTRKEALLIYQARLAAMGEMIGNIAHQWRQPLNNLGLIVSNLEDASNHNELEPEFVTNSVGKCRKLIANMSTTIDDFRYFLNPSVEKTLFSVGECIKIVLELLEENLRFNNVKTELLIDSDGWAYGYANQFSQAIFNIISNSLDSLVEKGDPDKNIKIVIESQDGKITTTIEDDGVGISDENLKNVFDVYFSTKSKQKGTGLGLYMTRLIIENNLNGKIEITKNVGGVAMKIILPEGEPKNAE